MLALISLAWRFRKLIAIAAAVLALLGAIAWALAWHASKVRSYGAERYASGEMTERLKWQGELARLADEHARQRRADEDRLRQIGIELNDKRVALREQRENFDREILALEQADQAAGAAPNHFDPRVLRLIR